MEDIFNKNPTIQSGVRGQLFTWCSNVWWHVRTEINIPPAQSSLVFILNWNWIMEKKGRKGLRNIRNCLKALSLFIHKFVLTKYLQKQNKNFNILQENVCFYLFNRIYIQIIESNQLPCYLWQVLFPVVTRVRGESCKYSISGNEYCHYLMQRKYWKGS